jgi:hypothetical protein
MFITLSLTLSLRERDRKTTIYINDFLPLPDGKG